MAARNAWAMAGALSVCCLGWGSMAGAQQTGATGTPGGARRPAKPAPADGAADGVDDGGGSSPLAAPPPKDETNFKVQAKKRRYGFTFGATTGFVLGNANGTPLELDKRKPEFEADTKLGLGFGGGSLFLGAVFNDYFAFELGGGILNYSGNGNNVSSVGMVFRLEAWPLFDKGGFFEDWGVGFEAGTGSLKIERDGNVVADAGTYSMVGLNTFYDGWRLWRLNTGPWLSVDYRRSETLSSTVVWLGLRTAFYGGP